MAFEVIRGEDCRLVLSHKKQTAYNTRLVDADLTAGKSIPLDTAVLGEIAITRAEEGPKAMTGHEWPDGTQEREIIRDTPLTLAMPLSSFMGGWAAAFGLGSITSVQEAVTTHYTHTIRSTNPLGSAGRQVLATSIYLDSNGPDAGRLRRVLYDLAITGFSVTSRIREMARLSIDLIGSGQEVTNPTITIPALESLQYFSGQGGGSAAPNKVEYGNKGGALTDITERIREVAVRVNQNVAADDGYHPGSGKFRGRLWFLARSFSLDLAIFVSRANRDLVDDMLNLTRKEIKITLDSGVLAGTGTVNHKMVLRFPDVRLTEVPMNFEDAGALYGVRVAENQVYRDTSVADTPCTITVDNTQSAYAV